ncbi:hypothetical protein C900_04200 [Fulvivirga imtechensis AK7]|uniref:Uncharacterized protein n=1 Tax=Fulvivirga imtechensis AK7 TaxID=1237149 RepID=L8JYV3_9BACT|nr:twin-arginine translocation signal domain-containing protein [Fulvivirga imtechensis]ELR73348.1 hypothetical protein C900_04200 [Fulvivirga imtechensis AK7]
MKKISRRKFIKLILLAVAAVLAGTLVIFDFNKIVVQMLKKDLAHLKINPDSFEKFVKEADDKRHWAGKFFDWKKKQFVRFGFIVDSLLPSFPYKYKYVQYRSDIVGDFLLSTDFFMNRMDSNKTINYIGLYNPYARPCSNPFSNLYYPET